MPEELYFIKTNPTIAKINLYNKLCREEKNILDFLPDDKQTSLEIIKNKLTDSLETLTREELLPIFSWFNNQYKADREELKTQLFINGFDFFYEILSENHVKNFHQILSDYEKHSKHHLNYVTDSQKFNQFLIYGIFYTDMIKRDEKNILRDFLKSDYKDLYAFAESQFNANEGNLAIEDDASTIYTYFSDLYDMTKYYKGSIIKLHIPK
ncbi:hypothetical protein [Chryseobacterium polytrichastri]|uniref:Uncharacterized protein n=1 Tax=Chryseobacterium polytrichastri TaxID=1302687 RepID=A0A1M6UCL7_9FLAO|nr:hypothetical protein [Chryseobacterium polytrichastri]SHK66929.1 hypothetical protein SAMN05444267_1006124 [Chryseobacterium polytrichastri]